jgi:hypothetical protein
MHDLVRHQVSLDIGGKGRAGLGRPRPLGKHAGSKAKPRDSAAFPLFLYRSTRLEWAPYFESDFEVHAE